MQKSISLSMYSASKFIIAGGIHYMLALLVSVLAWSTCTVPCILESSIYSALSQ